MAAEYRVLSSHTNNPPTDGQSAGCHGIEGTAEKALALALDIAREWQCERRPEREDERRIFYADRFVPGALPLTRRIGRTPSGVTPPMIRRPIPGVPIGDHYVVEVIRS